MPTRDKAPAALDELGKALERFTKQGDRGTALITAAWLHDSLAVRVRAPLTGFIQGPMIAVITVRFRNLASATEDALQEWQNKMCSPHSAGDNFNFWKFSEIIPVVCTLLTFMSRWVWLRPKANQVYARRVPLPN